MSVGAFVWSRYQSVSKPSQIFRIHCQEEVLLLTIEGIQNLPPIGDVNMSYVMTSGKGRARTAIFPFMVKLKWQSSAPSGYDLYGDSWVPLLSADIRGKIKKGAIGVYLGMPIDVRGTRPET